MPVVWAFSFVLRLGTQSVSSKRMQVTYRFTSHCFLSATNNDEAEGEADIVYPGVIDVHDCDLFLQELQILYNFLHALLCSVQTSLKQIDGFLEWVSQHCVCLATLSPIVM